MRITAAAKAETRQRIIGVAIHSFATKGWERTTTRTIAARAKIATGTLFNYFESKEAIIAALMAEALDQAQRELETHDLAAETLEEELFSMIWSEFRSLQRFRTFLAAAMETIFNPARPSERGPGESMRRNHLKAVEEIIARNGSATPLPPFTMQLYWTLYIGVFAYWTKDASPKQENTLALLDRTLKVFTASLSLGSNTQLNYEHQRSHRRVAARRPRVAQ